MKGNPWWEQGTSLSYPHLSPQHWPGPSGSKQLMQVRHLQIPPDTLAQPQASLPTEYLSQTFCLNLSQCLKWTTRNSQKLLVFNILTSTISMLWTKNMHGLNGMCFFTQEHLTAWPSSLIWWVIKHFCQYKAWWMLIFEPSINKWPWNQCKLTSKCHGKSSCHSYYCKYFR